MRTRVRERPVFDPRLVYYNTTVSQLQTPLKSVPVVKTPWIVTTCLMRALTLRNVPLGGGSINVVLFLHSVDTDLDQCIGKTCR